MTRWMLPALFVVLACNAFAQTRSQCVGIADMHAFHKPANNPTRNPNLDTIYSSHVAQLINGTAVPPCDVTGTYHDTQGGYITGNNHHGDLEKMQKFYVQNAIGVYQTLVYLEHATIAHHDSSVTSNIYEVDPITHGPGAVIYTSDTTQLGWLLGFPSPIGLNFPITVPVSDSFFVSLVLPKANGDTLVIIATADGCYPGHQIAWERRADSSFHPFNDGTSGTWGINTELFLAPVVEMTSSNGNSLPLVYKDLTLYNVSPNPVSNELTVTFDLKRAIAADVQIVDVHGKVMMQQTLGKASGHRSVMFDVSKLPAGVYNYGVRFNGDGLFSRFVKL